MHPATLIEKAIEDEGIVEFCRFYTDRRKQELEAAGTEAEKCDVTSRLVVPGLLVQCEVTGKKFYHPN